MNTLSEIEEYYKAREQQLLEKLHHVICIACFIELSQLLMKLFRITIHHRDWVIAISHQATVHHDRSCPLVCVIEKLTSGHEQKDGNGSFLRILNLRLQELKTFGSKLRQIIRIGWRVLTALNADVSSAKTSPN